MAHNTGTGQEPMADRNALQQSSGKCQTPVSRGVQLHALALAQFKHGEYARSLTLAVKASQDKAAGQATIQAALTLAARAALLCGQPVKALKYISHVGCMQPESPCAATIQKRCVLEMQYEARAQQIQQFLLSNMTTNTKAPGSIRTAPDHDAVAADLAADSSEEHGNSAAVRSDQLCVAAAAKVLTVRQLLDKLIADEEERQDEGADLAVQLAQVGKGGAGSSHNDLDSVAGLLEELTEVVSASVTAQIAFNLAMGYTAVMTFLAAYPDEVERLLIAAGTCKLAGDGPIRVRWPQMVLQRLLGYIRSEPRLACRSLALLAYAAQDEHLRHTAFVMAPMWAMGSGVHQFMSAAAPTSLGDCIADQQDPELASGLLLSASPFTSPAKLQGVPASPSQQVPPASGVFPPRSTLQCVVSYAVSGQGTDNNQDEPVQLPHNSHRTSTPQPGPYSTSSTVQDVGPKQLDIPCKSIDAEDGPAPPPPLSRSSLAPSMKSTAGGLSSSSSLSLDYRSSDPSALQYSRQSSNLSDLADVIQVDPYGSALLQTVPASNTVASLPAADSVLASLLGLLQVCLQSQQAAQAGQQSQLPQPAQPTQGVLQEGRADELPLPMACLASQLLHQYTVDTHSTQLLAALPNSNAVSLLLALYHTLHSQTISSGTHVLRHAWDGRGSDITAQMLSKLQGENTPVLAASPCCAAAHLVLKSLTGLVQQQPAVFASVAFTAQQDSGKRVSDTSAASSSTAGAEKVKLTPTPLLAGLLEATKQLAMLAPRCAQQEIGFNGQVCGYTTGKRAADPCAVHLSTQAKRIPAVSKGAPSPPQQQRSQQPQAVQSTSLLLRWLELLCAVGLMGKPAARELYRAGVIDLLVSQIFTFFQGDHQLVEGAEKLMAIIALQCDAAMDEMIEEGHVHGLIGVVTHLLPVTAPGNKAGKALGSNTGNTTGSKVYLAQRVPLGNKQAQRGLSLVLRALDKLSQSLNTCSGSSFVAVSKADGILNLVHALACITPTGSSLSAPAAAIAKPSGVRAARWLTKSGPLPAAPLEQPTSTAPSLTAAAPAPAPVQQVDAGDVADLNVTGDDLLSVNSGSSGHGAGMPAPITAPAAATAQERTRRVASSQSSGSLSTPSAIYGSTMVLLAPCVLASALLAALRDAARHVFFACMDRARKIGDLPTDQVPRLGWFGRHKPSDLLQLEAQLRKEWASALLPSPVSPGRHSSSGNTPVKPPDSEAVASPPSPTHRLDNTAPLTHTQQPVAYEDMGLTNAGFGPAAAAVTRQPDTLLGHPLVDEGASGGVQPEMQSSQVVGKLHNCNSLVTSASPSKAPNTSLAMAQRSDMVAVVTAAGSGSSAVSTACHQLQTGSEDGYDSDGIKQVYSSGPSKEEKVAHAAWIAVDLAQKLQWGQSADSLDVWLMLPPGTCKREVKVSITSTRLTVSLSWAGRVLDGPLTRRIKAAEALWVIEHDKQATNTTTASATPQPSSTKLTAASRTSSAQLTRLHIVLPKQEEHFWRSLFEGGPEKSHVEVLQEAMSVDEPVQSYDDLSEEAKQIVEEVRERQWMVAQGHFNLENSFDDFRLVLGDNLL